MENEETKVLNIVKDILPSVTIIFFSYLGLSKSIGNQTENNNNFNSEYSSNYHNYTKQSDTFDDLKTNPYERVATLNTNTKSTFASLLNLNQDYNDVIRNPYESIDLVFKYSLILYSIFILRGFIRLYLFSKRNYQENFGFKLFNFCEETLSYVLNIFYFSFVLYCLITFLNLNDNSIFELPFCTILLAFYTIIGCIDIIDTLLLMIIIFCSVFYFVDSILNDSKNFFEEHGISDDLLMSIDQVKYDEDKDLYCVICLSDIKKGEMIVKGKCGHSHHSECIFNWLKIKYKCPSCNSSNIF